MNRYGAISLGLMIGELKKSPLIYWACFGLFLVIIHEVANSGIMQFCTLSPIINLTVIMYTCMHAWLGSPREFGLDLCCCGLPCESNGKLMIWHFGSLNHIHVQPNLSWGKGSSLYPPYSLHFEPKFHDLMPLLREQILLVSQNLGMWLYL